MDKTLINIFSMLAIIVGSTVIGFEYGASLGLGIGLIAYGLRNMEA